MAAKGNWLQIREEIKQKHKSDSYRCFYLVSSRFFKLIAFDLGKWIDGIC
jgi:hypothetical protein